MGDFDFGWRRDLGLASRRESGELAGSPWAILSFAETSIHHENRCLWRFVVFAPGEARRAPVLSVDLEKDILGDFCLSLASGGKRRILEHLGASAPSYEDFKARALAAAGAALAASTDRGGGTGSAD